MKRIISAASLALIVAAGVLASGCASPGAARLADIEYSRGDFRSRFVEDQARCRAGGGQIVIMAWGGGLDRDGVPRTRVPYACR